MFKKTLASVVSAAVLTAGPGQLTLTAAAQTMTRAGVTGVSVTPPIATGLDHPVYGASSLHIPALTPGAPAPSLNAAANNASVPVAATPLVPAVAKAAPATVPGVSLAVIASPDEKAGVVEKAAALEALFENSSAAGHAAPEVLVSFKSRASLEKSRAGGSVSETTALGKRAWNAGLGMLGIGVKKMETPEVMAQRIIDQINAQKPVYNRKVQEASTLVEKLRRQISSEEAKIADLETTITAVLSDSDPANDILAAGMIKQQETLKASIASSSEQLSLAQQTLVDIKEERSRFYSDREETLAKIQAGLTKVKAAQIQKQMAELKGGFQIGDLQDNMGRFEDAVDEKVAGAKGAADSVESNPDQILKKAKDSLKNQEVQDELARRKAAIEAARKEKARSGGFVLALAAGAAVVGVIALASASFRGLLARAWNAFLGLFGMGVKRMETPEVMARRIIDQLNAQKPVYNRKVQEASTLVEKLRLQISRQEAQSAELDGSVTAILSDADPLNDVMAESLLKQKKTVDASTAMTKEQLAISEKTLVSIKEERARFYSEREEMLAQIQAGLTKAKAAEIQKEMAELKGGFAIGDLQDNMGRFEDAVDEKVAGAKGAADAAESNPDQILKQAKDSLKSREIQDEIARRKAAIEAARKEKAQSGGFVARGLTKGLIAYAFGAGFIAAVLGFIPGFVAVGLLDTALRFLGVMAIWAGMDGIEKGSGSSTLRSTLMVGAGVATILAAAGVFGALGGLTAVALGLTGFFFTYRGIVRFTSNDKNQAGGFLVELGIGAAVVGALALASASFRGLLARAWNAFLGLFGMGVKRMETPEVMARRIIDQLNAQKPVYNRKVQVASTSVERLRLQISRQEAQSAELDGSVTAILSDEDPLNDVRADSLLKQKKTVDASTAMMKEQLAISEKTLVSIKEERARFFSEREEMLAQIQAGLTKAKAAEIQTEMAELKGGFQIGDLQDNMGRFEDAVDEKVAGAKGAADAAESNPDQILKQAKDSLKSREIQDEIARRKAAIEAARKEKAQSGGEMTQGKALGYFAKVIGIGFALISPMLAAIVFAVIGAMALLRAPEQGRWLGRQLAVIGLGTLAVGIIASAVVAKLGLTVGAFSVGIRFVVPAGIALAAGVIAAVRAHKKDGATVASVAATPAGSSVLTPAPAASSSEGAPAAGPASSPKPSLSIKPLLARAWNVILAVFGMGVKKMETPEILAQRLIDQLNAAKPVYNNKVREASTSVEKLRRQISSEEAKIADLETTITAVLTDSDLANDIQAEGMLKQQTTLKASIAFNSEQLSLAEKTLEGIKEERARFFSDREETLAKIQAGLTKAKSAEIQKELAELKGGFSIGDLQDNMGRFEDAVDEKVAEAKGAVDAVESNPDQILKQAKDSLKSREIQDELARRKAAIEAARKEKAQAGGEISVGEMMLAAGIVAFGVLWGLTLLISP